VGPSGFSERAQRPTSPSAATAASGSALQITHGDQVAGSDCSKIGRAEADEGLGLPRCENKLDFETIGRMKINYSAQIATA